MAKNKTDNTKLALIIGGILLIVILVFWFLGGFNKRNQGKPALPQPTPRPEYQIQDEEKPVIKLIPRQDGHELKLVVEKIPSGLTEVEYELIYLAESEAGEFERGAGDLISLSGGEKSFERDILLGTASCTTGTCKYKYDEGVTGGTLTLRFTREDGQVFGFKGEFSLVSDTDELKTAKEEIIFNSSKKMSGYWVVIDTYGFPGEFKGTVKAGPFSAYGSHSAQVTIDAGEENVYLWSDSWEKITGKVSLPGIFLIGD